MLLSSPTVLARHGPLWSPVTESVTGRTAVTVGALGPVLPPTPTRNLIKQSVTAPDWCARGVD